MALSLHDTEEGRVSRARGELVKSLSMKADQVSAGRLP